MRLGHQGVSPDSILLCCRAQGSPPGVSLVATQALLYEEQIWLRQLQIGWQGSPSGDSCIPPSQRPALSLQEKLPLGPTTLFSYKLPHKKMGTKKVLEAVRRQDPTREDREPQ